MQPHGKNNVNDLGRRLNDYSQQVCLKTIFDHKERILRALNYIENNLNKPLRTDEVAKVACLSRFHFHRQFSYYTGNTVSDYVRNRRLAKAARLLLSSDLKITDIAFSMGYATTEAFTKAFKRRYGCPPSKYKNQYANNIFSVILGRSMPIVLRPLVDCANDKNHGIDAFWELQEMLAEVKPDCFDSTWISVFPDVSHRLDNATPYCVEFSSFKYDILFTGPGTKFEKNSSDSHAVLHLHQQKVVYRRVKDVISCPKGKRPKHQMKLPIELRSILLAPS